MGERSHQVQMMNVVYGQASEVIAWLGEGSTESQAGLKALEYFVNPSAVPIESPVYSADQDLPRRNLDPESMSSGVVHCIEHVLTQPWFSRVWTVKEAVLSCRLRLQCGSDWISWTADPRELTRTQYKIKSVLLSPQSYASGMDQVDLSPLLDIIKAQIREAAKKRGKPPPEKDLLDVMYDFRYRKSIDSRDKIFAMLGLAGTRENTASFAPDYSKSPEQVFHDLYEAIERLHDDLWRQPGV